jgi:hypothetical protein
MEEHIFCWDEDVPVFRIRFFKNDHRAEIFNHPGMSPVELCVPEDYKKQGYTGCFLYENPRKGEDEDSKMDLEITRGPENIQKIRKDKKIYVLTGPGLNLLVLPIDINYPDVMSEISF